MLIRPRRNRKNAVIRSLVRETRVEVSDLIYPLFVHRKEKEPIASLPEIYRYSLEDLLAEIERSLALGISSFALFPVIERGAKSNKGEEAYNKEGICIKAI